MKPIAKASLIAVLLGLGATGVAAQTYSPLPAGARGMSDNVIQVDHKKKYKSRRGMRHEKWAYNEKYGHRFRHRRAGYGYFYDGWWYPRPYWNEPGISIRLGL